MWISTLKSRQSSIAETTQSF